MYEDYRNISKENYNANFEKSTKTRYYGLTPSMNLDNLVLEVCNCLGFGSYATAHLLILETIGAETERGTYKDPSTFAGMGLCQFDKLPFKDTQDRTSTATKAKVYKGLGINIDLVKWEDLRYNPLLSILFCRLKYLLVRDPIPALVDDRARYWKKWYNSILGKGTEEHYLYANLNYVESDSRLTW